MKSIHESNSPRQHWLALTPEQQRQAIRDMAAMGFGDYAIAAACALSVEMVRQILAERRV